MKKIVIISSFIILIIILLLVTFNNKNNNKFKNIDNSNIKGQKIELMGETRQKGQSSSVNSNSGFNPLK